MPRVSLRSPSGSGQRSTIGAVGMTSPFGLRATWADIDLPPLLASTYVTEGGGEAIYRAMGFPLTTSAATVQRLMKIEQERNRRQREVAMQANLSALRLASAT